MADLPVSITNVSVSLPSVQEVLEVLLLQSGFNSAVVLSGAAFLGIAAGAVGAFSLLRKRALMGDALAHSALPGLSAAFIIGLYWGSGSRSLPFLLLGAAVSGVLGVLVVQFLVRHTRLTEDTAIGAVLSVFFGAGVVLLSVIQNLGTGSAGGLSHFIYGQTAAMSRSDALLTFYVAIAAVIATVFLFKEFRMVCFDPEYAETQGWPVSRIDLLLMALVVVVTVVGLQTVGMILIVAMLIVPAAAARFWTERLGRMVFLSAAIGGLSGYLGAAASSLLPRLPAGAVIVLTAGVFFTLSFFLAPQRGVLAALWKSFCLRIRVSEEHALRGVFEVLELSGNMQQAVEIENLSLGRRWPLLSRVLTLLRLKVRGFTEGWELRRISLTEKGREKAYQITRNHRLWEEYLLLYGNVAISHVDYSADLAEHVLSPKIVAELENLIAEKATLPEQLPSAHPLGEGR